MNEPKECEVCKNRNKVINGIELIKYRNDFKERKSVFYDILYCEVCGRKLGE